jgi:hypothetical protein
MRFSLMSLLLAFVVIGSSLATFGMVGLAVAAALLGIAAYIRLARDRAAAMGNGCAALLILFFVCTIYPAVKYHGEPARRSQCKNQLKQIVLALDNYHDLHGCFPPAYVPGPDGEPWHSWRVLILPFTEQQSLYDQYDFGEPWDGPNNRKLAGNRLLPYRCPSEPNRISPTTGYVAVVGTQAAWAGSRPRRRSEFRDGPPSTILVVEIAGSGIHWMEPRDLSFDEARRGINPPGRAGISSHHTQGHAHFHHEDLVANVALADGRVRVLADWLDPPTLEAMLTIDGNEPIDLDAIVEPRPRLHWPRIVSPTVLIVFYLILLLRPRRRREAERKEATP